MKSAFRALIFCSIVTPLGLPPWLSAQVTLNPTPTKVIGQNGIQLTNFNPNLVEGRELANPQGVALDLTTNPPGVYIADTANNRVLGYRNAVGFSNGAKADLVIGQADLVTTIAQGPGRTSRTTGTSIPTGLAVDASGNLYVVDSGNNRILRFPKPFTQNGDQIPDLVIGQPTFSTNGANQGGISAATLAFSASNGSSAVTFTSYLAFDVSGNLWATDPGNNRILRFNASVLGTQAMPGPAADVVLGQQDFTSNGVTGFSTASLSTLLTPTGIAFDSGGRLFVSESNNSYRGRILVWTPPFRNGQFATRLIGLDTDTPAPAPISERQLNSSTGALFAVGNQIGIADSNNSRLLLYAPYDQWTPNLTNQSAVRVIGQPDFNSGQANQNQPTAGPALLSHPASAAFSGSELFVADTSNHRMIVLPGSASTGFGPGTRVLGQDVLTTDAANLLEGREFNFSAGADAGIAVDLNSNPPRLYVADTYNNRVLGYKDIRNIQTGAKADIVIGQPDFQQSRYNYPSNSLTQPNQSGLATPTGLYVDPDGNLFVADSGNGRVLRFPKPFDNYQAGSLEAADLVLGQPNFFVKITDATSRTMSAPYGIAQASGNGLLVSDVVHNRVLYFPGTSKTFTSGQAATRVFGQKDFTSSGSGSNPDQMNAPHHIATDVDDHLYVADTVNGRILIFDHAPTAAPDPFAAIVLTAGLTRPKGVYVSPLTNELWVAEAAGTALRFPPFNSLAATGFTPNATLTEYVPLALAQDAWGNIFIADDANRVVIHYPGLSALNAANYLRPNLLAPGMISALYSTGNFHQFGTTSQAATAVPLPRTLNGVQVLFNGAPVPLFFAGTDQINFQVPSGAPVSGTANLQVLEVATGRILGDTTAAMTTVNPGLFTQAGNGIGAAIAVNVKDGTLNTQTNPAVAGDYITLYGTGEGAIPGGPADGDVIRTALASPRPPTVIVANHVLTGSDVQYAGVAPGLVGVWQVNVKIPGDVITLPNNPTQVIVLQDSIPSGGGGLGRAVIIYVKQPT